MEQSIIWIVISVVIGVIFIIYPFLSKRKGPTMIEYIEGQEEKERIFMQLADLEYDYQMDKLTDHDYLLTKSELTGMAAKFVGSQQIDQNLIEKEVDREIEEIISRISLEGRRNAHDPS